MTISAPQTLSAVNALVSARTASVRDSGALTQKIPALATPPLAVTLGSTRAQPGLYDASGLVRDLIVLDRDGSLPSTRQSGEAAASLQADLETALGLDSSNAGPAGSNRAALSSDAANALAAVLANGTGNETGLQSDLALQELLAQTLGGFSAGIDRARAAATAINASGVLQSATANESLRATQSLPADTLVLAAQALGSDRDAAARLANDTQVLGNNDASTQAFNRVLAADLEQAIAETDGARPRRRHTSIPETSDLLLAGFSIPGPKADATALADLNAATENGPLPVPGLATNALLRAGLRPLPVGSEQATSIPQVPDVTAEVPPSVSLRPTDATDRSAQVGRNAVDPSPARNASTANSPSTAAANAVADSAARPREPRYAELAAAMTMGAAVYRYQTTVSVTVPPGEVPPHRTVRAVLAIPDAQRVS